MDENHGKASTLLSFVSVHINKGKTFSLGDGGGEAVKTPGKGVFDKIK